MGKFWENYKTEEAFWVRKCATGCFVAKVRICDRLICHDNLEQKS